jgi:glycosyltransferase involved in cell wall biosynthesis
MRVLMLSPDAQMIDRRILQEAHTLVDAGYDVTVLSGFECAEPDAYEAHGVRVKRYKYDWSDRRRAKVMQRNGQSIGPMVWPIVRLASYLGGRPNSYESFVLEKIDEHEFDVVHVHDFPMLRCGFWAGRRHRAKIVYDSHEFYPVQSCFEPKDQQRYLAIERGLVRACAEVITVNPYIARLIADAYGIAMPQVILNAAPIPPQVSDGRLDALRRDRHALGAARKAKGLPENDFLFLYQGWISRERNLEPMIEAMKTQPTGVTLVIVGYGDHVRVLRQLAESFGVNEKVVFLGRVESDNLHEITMLCDVGVIPYRAVDEMHRYCSPNKLFEFTAAHLPILASDLPYLRDVVQRYRIGWLGNLDTPEGVATQMSAILAATDDVGRARRNQAVAATELNWSIEGAKLIKLYNSIFDA